MQIVVCIKQVVHIYVPTGVDLTTNTVVKEGVARIVNPYDEVALEEAVRLRDSAGQGGVTVVTVGPFEAEESLRWCLALGADHAIHVLDETGLSADPLTVSHVLAPVIRTLNCDLVLCGKMSIDCGMGQVGTFLAELLDLPLVTAVTRIELDDQEKKAEVQRALERGNREVVQCQLPAVFTAEKSLNTQRYPTLPGRRRAKTKQILRIPVTEVCPGELIGPPLLEVVRIAPPKLRPRKVLSPDASLSAAGRLKFILSGGMGDKKGGHISGDSEQLAKGIFDFLRERRFIRNGKGQDPIGSGRHDEETGR